MLTYHKSRLELVLGAKAGAQTALALLNGKLSRKLQSDFRASSTIQVSDLFFNIAIDQRDTATTFTAIGVEIYIHYVQQYTTTTAAATTLVPTVTTFYCASANIPWEGQGKRHRQNLSQSWRIWILGRSVMIGATTGAIGVATEAATSAVATVSCISTCAGDCACSIGWAGDSKTLHYCYMPAWCPESIGIDLYHVFNRFHMTLLIHTAQTAMTTTIAAMTAGTRDAAMMTPLAADTKSPHSPSCVGCS